MSVITLRVDEFLDLARSRGHHTYEQQAAATGLGIATMHRLRSGGTASATAVASICSAYGVEFADVWAIGQPAAAPATAESAQPKHTGKALAA
ncbi:hypothetical protein [Streptomyces mirabilis]|uniref:hypothetical protein n=1 Tax=Streptomyces mirabilis TaxID=68239 RepID=UPI002256A496|nr:hypothetical protein [Streptomyces mirabilis]MCX4615752.1 hypothetical protein [Streptomyces mirabilis]